MYEDLLALIRKAKIHKGDFGFHSVSVFLQILSE